MNTTLDHTTPADRLRTMLATFKAGGTLYRNYVKQAAAALHRHDESVCPTCGGTLGPREEHPCVVGDAETSDTDILRTCTECDRIAHVETVTWRQARAEKAERAREQRADSEI